MIIFFLLFPLHALYISVIEMNIDQDGYAEVVVKVFSDDLADCILNFDGSSISREGDYQDDDLLRLEAYFKEHFYVFNTMDSSHFKINKYSSEDMTVWLHFNTDKMIEKGNSLHASFLLELFPDQVNMLHLKSNSSKRFYQLKRGKKSVELNP